MVSSLTVSHYLKTWLAHVEKTRRHTTYSLYESLIRNYAIPKIGRYRLAQLRRSHIRSLLDSLCGRAGSRTRQLVHRVLRQAFAEAIEDELITVNPCFRKDKPRHESADRRPLTLDEARKMLKAARRSDYYALFFLALVTGMRQGEIFALRWDAVDFDTSSLFVRASLGRDRDGTPVLTPPKASRRRRIDMGDALRELLIEHRRLSPDSLWVFADRHGHPLEKDRFVRGIFHPLLKRAGIRQIRFHDLRHTSATLALASGVNVKVVSERLGHSSAQMTLDVYTRALPTLQRDAAALMERLMVE
jgi:integrase